MNFLLRLFSISMLVSLGFISCNEQRPERDPNDWRTPQYIEDSTICANYVPMFDSILMRLPAGMKLGNQCSADIRRRVNIMRDSMPYMLFEPKELSKTTSFISYFRYERLQNAVTIRNEGFALHWGAVNSLDGTVAPTGYFTIAQQITEVMDNRYICVFINNQSEYVEPRLDTVDQQFIGGKIEGTCVIVDFIVGKPLCSFEVSAASSESVHVGSSYNYSDYKNQGVLEELASRPSRDGVVADLWYNLAFEIERRLKE